ncbi:MAG: hypothetical protein ACJ72N_24010 [Labedaea sp.]
MATVLDELGVLVRSRPSLGAPAAEVAAWYERKAAMLRQVAAGSGSDAARAGEWATLATRHAAGLGGAT